MKKYYKIAILLILIQVIVEIQLYAQPILTQSNNAPVVGDSFVLNYVDVSSINEGASGANVTWDFSNLSSIGIINKIWVDPVLTPNDTFFTEANISYYDTINDGWVYYFTSDTGLLFVGFDKDHSENKYSDFVKMRVYPFSYNDYCYDDYSVYNLYQFLEDSMIGSSIMTADAYGTLKLPYCTLNNVLRIKREINETLYRNSAGYSVDFIGEDYFWYVEGIREPVFALQKIFTSGYWSNDKGYYLENIPNGIAEYGENTGFYPNPASEYIIVESGQSAGSKTVVEITGINGKTYIQTTIDKNSRVDISGLSPGIYFVKVNDGKSMKVNKLVVK